MKNLLIAIMLLFVVSSCEEDNDDQNALAKAKARIEANSIMIDDAFDKASVLMKDHATVLAKIEASETRASFIASMETITKDVVNNSIVRTANTVGWSATKFTYNKSTTNLLKYFMNFVPIGIEGPNPGTGVLDNYSRAIDDTLARIGIDQVVVSSYTITATSGSMPTIGDLIIVKENLEPYILQSTSDQELDNAIELFIKANPKTEIIVRLLVPAVQKIRQKASALASPYQKFSDILLAGETIEQRKLWDRKMQHAAFLSAIAIMISPDYEMGRNENFAAVVPQIAVYHAVTVLAWSRGYDINQ